MPYTWVMITASSPKGGILSQVCLPRLYLTPRESPEGKRESVGIPAFSGHLQDWAVFLPSGNHHHRTMVGKSEAL